MLVEDPDPIQHLTGVDLACTEAVHHRWTVLGGLVHLAGKISFVIELDLVLRTAYLERKGHLLNIKYVLHNVLQCMCATYKVDHLAGAEAVVQTHPALVIWVLAPGQNILVAHEVGPLVDHPRPTLHADGVTPVQVGMEVRTVAVALIPTALEVLVLVENDLYEEDIGIFISSLDIVLINYLWLHHRSIYY